MHAVVEPVLSCRSLTRTYRSRWLRRGRTAVDGVDLDVPAGSAFALVGPNGAGKTTLMLMAIGLMRPTSGHAKVAGHDAASPGARRHVGFVPEKFQLPAQLRGSEFLRMHSTLAGLEGASGRRRIDEVLEQVDLSDRRDDRLGTFSKGMQQRMAIAQALLGQPRVLVLDEPTSALDPLQRRRLRDTLRQVHADGCTIVLNSHNLAEVEDICDHVAILQQGQLVASGALRDMVARGTGVRLRVGGWSQELAAALQARVALEAVELGGAEARLLARVAGDDDVAWIAAQVVGSGAALLELTPTDEGLEDLFVRTVSSSDADGGQA